jgi:hypothetical protein
VDAAEKRESLAVPGSESRPSSPTLYRLSFELSMYPLNHFTDSVEIPYDGKLPILLFTLSSEFNECKERLWEFCDYFMKQICTLSHFVVL